MRQNKYRAQILLEPDQHKLLAEAARQGERSISDLVREIVQEWALRQEGVGVWEKRSRALERLRQIRESIEQEYGVYSASLLDETQEGNIEPVGEPISAALDESKLKEIFKQAASELLEERKDLLYDLIVEVIEDTALRRAIQEGEAGEAVSTK